MRAEDVYVAAWRAARAGAQRTGTLSQLEARPGPRSRHLRSLFAIHDVADMIHLDLAWWSYDAVAAVDRLLAARGGNAQVFEYGAGASTAWLAKRAAQVTSVEHDAGFARYLDSLLDPSLPADVHVVEPVPSATPVAGSNRRGHDGMDFEPYVHAIDAVPGEFDLIVVDGRARVACARHALPRLADGGVLLLDNANRDEYASIVEDPDLAVTVLRGRTPCLPYPTSTALIRPRHVDG